MKIKSVMGLVGVRLYLGVGYMCRGSGFWFGRASCELMAGLGRRRRARRGKEGRFYVIVAEFSDAAWARHNLSGLRATRMIMEFGSWCKGMLAH